MVMLDHWRVISRCCMEEVTNYNTLINITGGGISGTLLNAISNGVKTLYEIGQKFGTAIRRIRARSLCKI